MENYITVNELGNDSSTYDGKNRNYREDALIAAATRNVPISNPIKLSSMFMDKYSGETLSHETDLDRIYTPEESTTFNY